MLKKLVIVGSLLAVGPLLAGCMINSYGSYNWWVVSFSDQQLCNYVANYNDQASINELRSRGKSCNQNAYSRREIGNGVLEAKARSNSLLCYYA